MPTRLDAGAAAGSPRRGSPATGMMPSDKFRRMRFRRRLLPQGIDFGRVRILDFRQPASPDQALNSGEEAGDDGDDYVRRISPPSIAY